MRPYQNAWRQRMPKHPQDPEVRELVNRTLIEADYSKVDKMTGATVPDPAKLRERQLELVNELIAVETRLDIARPGYTITKGEMYSACLPNAPGAEEIANL